MGRCECHPRTGQVPRGPGRGPGKNPRGKPPDFARLWAGARLIVFLEAGVGATVVLGFNATEDATRGPQGSAEAGTPQPTALGGVT